MIKLSKEVKHFAERMQEKLNYYNYYNEYKGRVTEFIDTGQLSYCVERLLQETGELVAGMLTDTDPEDAEGEAADVANFAMMVAYCYGGLPPQTTARAWDSRRIVCLCGSTRFYREFQKANYDETMAGNIVLSVGFYMHEAKAAHGEDWGCTPEQKRDLDELHLRKIDMADEILVINVGGYVGKSTSAEIAYARHQGKIVRWLEPDRRCGKEVT